MLYAPNTCRSSTPARSAVTTHRGCACTTAWISGRARNNSVWIWNSLGTAYPPSSFTTTVEIDDTNVVDLGEQQPPVTRSAAAQQDTLIVQPQADVPQHVGGEFLLRQDPARGGNCRAQLGQLPDRGHAGAPTGTACSTLNTN